MFFAYNNGIAATASAASVTRDASGLRLTHVTDLQIVNGGQTTATLAGLTNLTYAIRDIHIGSNTDSNSERTEPKRRRSLVIAL